MTTLDDLLQDIYALEGEMRTYERKYGVLSETFYESYQRGEEPPDDAWVRDWTAWASAYKLWLHRAANATDGSSNQAAIQSLRTNEETIADMIAKTARHDPIPIPA